MDWGSKVTYIGSTTLREKTVTFGIKDSDRTKHFSILGRTGSGRGDMVVSMALQDIERGVGVVLLDATGTSATKLLERISPEHSSRVVFLDPSDAEYPYSWNLVDDIKTLSEAEQVSAYVEAVSHVFKITPTTFVAYVAGLILKKPDATLVMFHTLLTDEKFRGKFFENDDAGREALEAQMKLAPDAVEALEREGKYIAKDTLVRNLISQKDSKFTLDHLPDGQIVIVDFSHIRMYPTRMTPIVCTFAHAVRMASRRSQTPIALYMHDTIRYLSEVEIDSLLSPHHNVAVTIADTIIQESDQERRLYALSRSSSVASFAAHPGDKTLLEHAFYPFVEVDDLVRLEPKEFIVALTIDGVRGKPFFAQALPLGEKKNLSYQDMVVAARQRYTTVRSKVDAILKAQTTFDDDDEDDDDGPSSPRGFQDAFRSIFAKQAEKAKAAASGAPVGENAQGTSSETPPDPLNAPLNSPPPAPPEKREVPEDLLKQMLYVAPVSLALFLLPLIGYAQVVFSEIHYDLAGSDKGGEWIEVYNDGAEPVSFAGWKFFEAGVHHTLTGAEGAMIQGGQYSLIVRDADMFRALFPSATGVFVESSFSLSNSGETLMLKDASGVVADSVSYTSLLGGAGNGMTISKVEGKWVETEPTPWSVARLAPPPVVPTSIAVSETVNANVPNEKNTEERESQVAAVSNSDVPSVPQKGNPLIGWIAALLSVIGIASAGVVFLRSGETHSAYTIEEIHS